MAMKMGSKPRFGYPNIDFNNIIDGINALNVADFYGDPDPVMQIVNQEKI